jgi:hypothetical protein
VADDDADDVVLLYGKGARDQQLEVLREDGINVCERTLLRRQNRYGPQLANSLVTGWRWLRCTGNEEGTFGEYKTCSTAGVPKHVFLDFWHKTTVAPGRPRQLTDTTCPSPAKPWGRTSEGRRR